MSGIRRREFITLLGGTAAWPLTARAQRPAIPVIGFLRNTTAAGSAHLVKALREGLKEAGFIEGQNVAIEYHWADDHPDRLASLAADLARRQVAAIVTNATSLQAVKAVITTVPTVFVSAIDPVKLSLVASLNRPGGNATGVYFFVAELASKQLELLRELVPAAGRVGILVNPGFPQIEALTKDVSTAASSIGVNIDVVQASDSREIELAFGTLIHNRADALLVGPDAFFLSRRLQLATLAARHAIPAIYNVRDYPEAGGLMSYGTSQTEAYRQAGIYTGRILKGANPGDLPVMQSTKFELVINLPTARAIGLEIPPTLLARADEVIE